MVFIGISNGPPPADVLSVFMNGSVFGIYIHIPFCIQRCFYCDFATYAKDQIKANQAYVDTILLEAQKRRNIFTHKKLDTIYFGGGTPSLLTASQISQIVCGLKALDFKFAEDIEITIEVNPATLDENKCLELKQAGINRLSIGCQSFNDQHLKNCNREHNTDDTFKTIELTKKYFSNYSLDLLFSLPNQNIKELIHDLEIIQTITPPHVSAYCLTLKDGHPMNKGRCSEEEQVEMFHLVFSHLDDIGLNRYEISNFSHIGFESKHNNIYWNDHDYWGLGLSAHSYKNSPEWGRRFWNPSTYSNYMDQVEKLSPQSLLEESFSPNLEILKKYESLTDFCHTHLRLSHGLSLSKLRHKFGEQMVSAVLSRLNKLQEGKLVLEKSDHWALTEKGLFLSNQVFAELLFSQADIDNS